MSVVSIFTYLCVGVFFLWAELLCAQESSPDSSFQILYREDNRPVPFAQVYWWPVEKEVEAVAVSSDKNGRVRILSPDLMGYGTGEAVVSIFRIGCQPFRDTLFLADLDTVFLEPDVFNIDQVTITGTRTAHLMAESPVLTQLISGADIGRSGLLSVQDILESEVPGVEAGEHAGKSTMQMMGLAPQSTLVLVDGERVAGETGGSIDFSRLQVPAIDRIEIVRGASSVLYGSSAMGGVVNVITKEPQYPFGGMVKLRYGQRFQRNGSAAFSDSQAEGSLKDFYLRQDLPNLNGDLMFHYRGKSFMGRTLLNLKSADGYQLYDSRPQERYYPQKDSMVLGAVNPTPMSINGSNSLSLQQMGRYEWNNMWRVSLQGNYFRQEAFDFSRNNTHELFKGYRVAGEVQYHLFLDGNITLSHTVDAYHKYDVLEKRDEHRMGYGQVFSHSKMFFSQKGSGGHAILFGVENFNESLKSDRFQVDTLVQRSQNDAAMVFQDEYKVSDRVSVVGGLRMGWNSTYHSYFTPSLSVAGFLSPFTLRASYSRGFRAPGLKELHMQWNHLGMFQVMGNPALKPEQNDYYMLSIDYLHPKKRINVTTVGSYNHLYDQIDDVWNGSQTVLRYDNFEEVNIFTTETLLRWRLFKNFVFKGGYLFIKKIQKGESMDFSPVSPHSVTSRLESRFSRGNYQLDVRLSVRYKGAKSFNVMEMEEYLEGLYFPVANGEYYRVRQPAYCLMHLVTNQGFGRGVSLQVGVDNLLNYRAPIVSYNSSVTPGRRYFMALECRF